MITQCDSKKQTPVMSYNYSKNLAHCQQCFTCSKSSHCYISTPSSYYGMKERKWKFLECREKMDKKFLMCGLICYIFTALCYEHDEVQFFKCSVYSHNVTQWFNCDSKTVIISDCYTYWHKLCLKKTFWNLCISMYIVPVSADVTLHWVKTLHFLPVLFVDK